MIRAKKHIIFPTFNFHDENEVLGTLKVSLLTLKANFHGKEGDFNFFRETMSQGNYYLSTAGNDYLSQALKPNGIGLKYKVEYKREQYVLKPGELFQDDLHLHYELFLEDNKIGLLVLEKPYRDFLIKVEVEMPPIVQIFLFWLSLRAWIGEKGWCFTPLLCRAAS